jgi:hypothetical protein
MKDMCFFYKYISLKWHVLLNVNQSSSQKGQSKEKSQSKWPCFNEIEHIDLILVR